MENNRICLCDRCFCAIRARGEKAFKLGSLEFSDSFEGDADELLNCEWCEEEFLPSQLYECSF